ncbi:hypothetical protein [Haloferula rosea]|uniref:Uncharacterized protein n=1 Tax=Haloferula rosea TaxID=490093 RepID=A0A934VHJ6_9BACT|nr:hypothetical protein [Haloferula rosea]MBK1828740.1 hypothetical protein [Haloferula rosea]
MPSFLPIFGLGLILMHASHAQVRIHDTAVRLLAKPFGIEKRIQLESIDALHCAADGTKRITLTLRNSGVKEVVLNDPSFSLDIVLPDGNWASLGTVGGASITFPITGKDHTVSRTYVATFDSKLKRADLEAYLRDSAKSSGRLRLLGRADMLVNSGGKTEFSKKNLKLEVAGVTTLATHFKAVSVSRADQLPTVGRR